MTAPKPKPESEPMPQPQPQLWGDAAYEKWRSDQYQASVAEAKTLQMDDAPDGGRFLVNGVLVDHNGQPITEE